MHPCVLRLTTPVHDTKGKSINDEGSLSQAVTTEVESKSAVRPDHITFLSAYRLVQLNELERHLREEIEEVLTNGIVKGKLPLPTKRTRSDVRENAISQEDKAWFEQFDEETLTLNAALKKRIEQALHGIIHPLATTLEKITLLSSDRNYTASRGMPLTKKGSSAGHLGRFRYRSDLRAFQVISPKAVEVTTAQVIAWHHFTTTVPNSQEKLSHQEWHTTDSLKVAISAKILHGMNEADGERQSDNPQQKKLCGMQAQPDGENRGSDRIEVQHQSQTRQRLDSSLGETPNKRQKSVPEAEHCTRNTEAGPSLQRRDP